MIYSGVDDEEPPAVDPAAVRAEFGFPADAPMVLFAGRLAEQKRVDDLLKALDLLQHVQPDVRTLIAGDGPLRERLEETAQAYRLDGRVRFLGHRDDVPRLLAAADMLVLPSSVRGPAQRGARGDAVPQAGRRHRRAGDDRGRRGRRDRPARPDRRPGPADPGDPRPRPRPRSWPAAWARPAEPASRAHFSAAAMIDHFAELYEQLARSKGIGAVDRIPRLGRADHIDNCTVRVQDNRGR